ncbi:MAG: threonine synthase, partial [Bdellovibrionales bacterium RBG_16_40_8]
STRKKVRVVILYPKNKISDLQEKQLTCWGESAMALAVRGNFDDCQRLVKTAFLSSKWQQKWELISANSINLGRLLPQMVYYAGASIQFFEKRNRIADFIIPTGNLGNAVAAFWAKEMGFPIGKIGLALNANRTIANFLQSGQWHPVKSIATLANAMDVGNASNFERLRELYSDINTLRKVSVAVVATDEEISESIHDTYLRYKYIICPHTATAFNAQKKLGWHSPILVATAHPAKFADIVLPLVKGSIPMPEQLKKILNLPTRKKVINADLTEFAEAIENKK